MSGVKDPDRYVTRQLWPGKPVTCSFCLQGGVPTMTHDGWRMPVHDWDDTGQCGPCPGSMGGVSAVPVPLDMSERIEEHVGSDAATSTQFTDRERVAVMDLDLMNDAQLTRLITLGLAVVWTATTPITDISRRDLYQVAEAFGDYINDGTRR